MNLRNRWLNIWHDPVWSKVIAALIVAGVTYLLLPILRSLLPQLAALSGIALWIILTLAFTSILLLLLWSWSSRRRKTLVFLSSGGTCRDPMAKAIASKLLETRKLKHPIDIRAAGLGPISKPEASYAARYVINEMYNEDLLREHKPELLTPELAARADLILAMDGSLLTTRGKTLPHGKTFLLKEFFGEQGDVVDPWPDGKDVATLSRYRRCAEELRHLLTEHLDKLVQVLDL